MSHITKLVVCLVVAILSQPMAHAAGVAGGLGVMVVDNFEERMNNDLDDEFDEEVDFDSESMVGPLVSVALRGGDWVDHQLLAQFASSRAPYDVHLIEDDESAGGSISLETLGVGYQLGLDVWGKEGLHRLSPCLAVGFLVGPGWLRILTSSNDTDLQSELEQAGVDDQREMLTVVSLHALAGLRVRLDDNLGIRAVVGRGTTGGLSWWQPQVVMDFTPRRVD